MTHKRKLTLIALITALFSVYSCLWFYAAHQIENGILSEINALRAQSYQIDHGPIHVKGYPLKIKIEVAGLYIETSHNDPLSLSIEGIIQGTGSLFNPWKINLSSKAPLSIRQDSQGTEVQSGLMLFHAKQSQMSLDLSHPLNPSDPLSPKTIDVFLTDARIPLLNTTSNQIHLKFDRHQSDLQISNCVVDAHMIKAPIQKLSSLPASIDHIHMACSLKGTRLYDLPLDQFILKWYETDGMIDMTNIILEWGDIKIAGSGNVTLDEALQPVASFAMEIKGLHKTLDVLKTQGLISEGIEVIVLHLLKRFQEEKRNHVTTDAEIYHKISLSIQNNGETNDFIIGTIPIFQFPYMNWKAISDTETIQKGS